MNPAKLLASRNIILGIAVIGVLLVVFVVFQTRTGSSETMPSADRVGAPPAATGDVVPLDTVLDAFAKNRTTARKYRQSPFRAHVDAVTPMNTGGWAALVALNGGRAVAYVAQSQWQASAPALAAGQERTFTCADWQTAGAKAATLYGCGVVAE